MGRIIAMLISATLMLSCSLSPRDYAIEQISRVEVMDGERQGESFIAEVVVRNDSPSQIVIVEGSTLSVKMKGDELITLTLQESVVVEPLGRVSVESQWSVRRDDPATLYAMRRYPIERYLDRMTIDYSVTLEGVGKRIRTLRGRGIAASDIDMNFEKLLQ